MTDDVTVYDQPSDPLVGAYVAFEVGDDTVVGEVVEGRESEAGTSVVVEQADGATATVPWDAEIAVNSASGVTCPACGFPSRKTYRCESCGHDLAGKGASVGRQGGDA